MAGSCNMTITHKLQSTMISACKNSLRTRLKLWYLSKVEEGVTTLPKTFTQMGEIERIVNRARIATGMHADYEVDEYGVQTAESHARDRQRNAGVVVLEVCPAAHASHVAVAGTIERAVSLAKERGLRWACGGPPAAVAAAAPPLDATAAICSTIEHASVLATAPRWHHARPQIIRKD
jgi:hypothetical protein